MPPLAPVPSISAPSDERAWELLGSPPPADRERRRKSDGDTEVAQTLSVREQTALISDCCVLRDRMLRLGLPHSTLTYEAILEAIEIWRVGEAVRKLLEGAHERALREAALSQSQFEDLDQPQSDLMW